MHTEEPVTFSTGSITLEGRLYCAPQATRAAVLCHPHPQYGGDMNNNVVLGCARRLQAAGIATLRFNFRGVGASQGRYDNGVREQDDAKAAVAFLLDRSPGAAVTVAGYSFGALVALQAGSRLAEVARMAGVAPPVAMANLRFLAGSTKPLLLVAGADDPYCPLDTLVQQTKDLCLASVSTVAGADHFFAGFEEHVGETLAGFVTGVTTKDTKSTKKEPV